MAYYNSRYNITDSDSYNDWVYGDFNTLSYLPNIQILCPPDQSLINDYRAQIRDCLIPVLKKIPNTTESELEEILVGFVSIFEKAVLDISRVVDVQNQTNLELRNMSEEAASFLSKNPWFLGRFMTREESQNQLISLRDQLTKDFDDKIRVILEHEVHSDKSNTELLSLIFEDTKDSDSKDGNDNL